MSQQEEKNQRVGNAVVALCVFTMVFLVCLSTFMVFKTRNIVKENEYIGRSNNGDTISFTGESSMNITPDIARVSMGYTAEKSTVAKAQEEVTKVMNKFEARLQEIGIKLEDIKTKQYNIYPQYSYTNSKRVLTGYQVSQNIEIKIRDLEKSAEVLSLAGELGLNEINGLTFEIDDKEKYIGTLKEEAIKKAKINAKLEADLLDIELGDIVNYYFSTDGDRGIVYDLYSSKAFATNDAIGESLSAPTLNAGEQELKVKVNITYRLR